MAITYQKARQLSDDITKQLAGRESEWRSFLRSTGNLYKYSFSDQLMIYAQRPDASATASYETWNNVGRYVRRGSKGIALFKGDGDGLKYVFDVSDTDVSPYRKGQQVLPPWKMKKRHTQAVFERLESEYGADGTGLSYPDRLRGIVSAAVEDSFAELHERMEQEAGGSFLEDLDEANRKVLLHQAVSNSVSYMVFTRMGVDPELYLDGEDFSGLWNFNTPELLGVLGEAVNDLAGPILREVEREVKRIDRENIQKPLAKEASREYTKFSNLKRENERSIEHEQQSDIHDKRGLSVSQPDDGRTGGGHREVREDAAQIPQGAPEGPTQRPAVGREAESPLAGNERENQGGDRQAGGGNAGNQPGAGEGSRSDGVGAAQEHADRQSGGNRDTGDNLQLSFFHTLPDIPSPEKQNKRIQEAESKKLPVSFSSPEYVLDFRYVNNRLIVYNHANYDPDKLSPIVARVEPDGGIVILDEKLPEKERLEIQHVAETELDRYKAEAEARTQGMLDAALSAIGQDRVGQEAPQNGHPYAVGDTVYLENDKPYEINRLWGSSVDLSDSSLSLPVMRNESIRDFERLLRGNAKNSRITDYLGADLELFNPDAEEVLAQGLLAPELRDALAGILDRGGSNSELADCLREHFGTYNAETMNLYDGSPADYFTDSNGLRIELQGDYLVKMSYSWEEIAPVVRSLYEQSRQREPAPEREQSPAQADSGIKPPDLTEEETAALAHEWEAEQQKTGDLLPDPFDRFDVPAYLWTREQEEQPPSEYDYNAIPPLTLDAPPERTVEQPQPERAAPTASNFRITDEHLGEGGQKTKYGYNVAAIRTLKQIEGENRHAAPEEQETLHRYVGWGGIPQAFDENNPKWTQEYAELKELLTPAEYEAARRSTLNAHYTSPTVITAMYETLGRLGFRKGNLLEPACGAGNFFGLLPESMRESRLYGVELDSITGRIAGELYPDARIQVKGFQDAEYPDSFFDAAISNVPFGDYRVADKRYDRHKFHIHDYFFAKTLDKVRPGGIIAFVTSSFTMDKKDSSVRKYLAQQADLLGAVRLPNNAFYKNAGTEVTTDILFLQKRDRLMDLEPDWVRLGQTEDGIPVNSYFAKHPEMVLGKMVYDKSMYGSENSTACHPIEGADLAEQLREALSHIDGQIEALTLDDVADLEQALESIPADPDVRNHSYTQVDGRLYFRENSIMKPVQTNKTAAQRIVGMMEVRDCARRVIDYQLNGYGDEDIREAQAELNRVYDTYTAKYDLLNSNGNRLAFSEDASYPLLCSLENLDKEGKLESKADLFTRRTIKAYEPVTHVDTAQEALAVSLCEKACVDIGFMSSLMGGDKLDAILDELRGVIFKDPLSAPDDLWNGWQTADEYLSGNVREKLAQAEEAAKTHPQYNSNVRSLQQVQPKELTATEIEVKLGTTWIPQGDYTGFLRELLGVPSSHEDDFSVRYVESLNEYRVNGVRGLSAIQTALKNTYGTKRIDAMTILHRTLNQKTVRVYDAKTDEHGNDVRVLNPKETAIAQNRQEKMKRAFRDWIWKDQERRDRLCGFYNERFNSTRPREFDGSHLDFPGMNPEIRLEPHQKDAVARILYGGNTLLAHVVC